MKLNKSQWNMLQRLMPNIEHEMGINLGVSIPSCFFITEKDDFILFESDDNTYHLLHPQDFSIGEQNVKEYILHDDDCQEFYTNVLKNMENGTLSSSQSLTKEFSWGIVEITLLPENKVSSKCAIFDLHTLYTTQSILHTLYTTQSIEKWKEMADIVVEVPGLQDIDQPWRDKIVERRTLNKKIAQSVISMIQDLQADIVK